MDILDRTVQIGSSILLQGITALSQYVDIKPPNRLHTYHHHHPHHVNYTDSPSSSDYLRPRLTKYSIGHHHHHHHGRHHHHDLHDHDHDDDHHHGSTLHKVPVADCTSSSSSVLDNCVNVADTSNNVSVTNYSNKVFMNRVLEMFINTYSITKTIDSTTFRPWLGKTDFWGNNMKIILQSYVANVSVQSLQYLRNENKNLVNNGTFSTAKSLFMIKGIDMANDTFKIYNGDKVLTNVTTLQFEDDIDPVIFKFVFVPQSDTSVIKPSLVRIKVNDSTNSNKYLSYNTTEQKYVIVESENSTMFYVSMESTSDGTPIY